MATYNFTLIFALHDRDADPTAYTDRLFEAGCDDAIIGVGSRGSLALEFSREASSGEEAVYSAVEAVRRAVPKSHLIEAKPDLVNLAELADLLGCSRQNMRKYAAGEMKSVTEQFPLPSVTGSTNLWHLREVAHWLAANTTLQPSNELIDIAQVTCKINLDVNGRRFTKQKASVGEKRFRVLHVTRELVEFGRRFEPCCVGAAE